MAGLVLRQDNGGLATLTLNRPEKLNALNVEMFVELRAHVESIAAEIDRVGLVIVRGAGKCFSAGHDLADIAAGERPPRPNFQAETIERLANLPQPVSSAVHGHCYTGALELALAGDLIVAAESAKFADTHARWALTPAWGMSQRLPRRIGTYKAREMMFTCRSYSGQEALAMGLANLCVPDESFDKQLQSLAEMILANSWHSHRANKALLLESDGMPLAAGLAHEVYRSRGVGPDMRERIASFNSRSRGG
ncbi:MAG TPA: enoyl-CoA hydratase/isomerase family protein [Candidatus Binataceae bacterium]|nr:enoyl-CoA hydratase/isomerase family protein [Candidatus Binataceae bacterium]